MKKTITLTIALLVAQFSSYAQAYDGYHDNKMFLGYTNVGGYSGIEYQTDFGINDLYSWGFQGTYLFNIKVNNEEYSHQKTFKFLDSFDAGIFIRFHFLEAFDLPKHTDFYIGGDLTIHSIGAHTGFKYNFNDIIGLYAMYKQGFTTLLKENISLSQTENGDPIPSFFTKKAAFSVGITINILVW